MSDCEEKIYSNDYVDFMTFQVIVSSGSMRKKILIFIRGVFSGYLIFRQIPMLLFQSAMDFWMRRRLRFRGY